MAFIKLPGASHIRSWDPHWDRAPTRSQLLGGVLGAAATDRMGHGGALEFTMWRGKQEGAPVPGGGSSKLMSGEEREVKTLGEGSKVSTAPPPGGDGGGASAWVFGEQ